MTSPLICQKGRKQAVSGGDNANYYTNVELLNGYLHNVPVMNHQIDQLAATAIYNGDGVYKNASFNFEIHLKEQRHTFSNCILNILIEYCLYCFPGLNLSYYGSVTVSISDDHGDRKNCCFVGLAPATNGLSVQHSFPRKFRYYLRLSFFMPY